MKLDIRPSDVSVTSPTLVWWKLYRQTAVGEFLYVPGGVMQSGYDHLFDISWAPDKVSSAKLNGISLLSAPTYHSSLGIMTGLVQRNQVGGYRSLLKAPSGSSFTLVIENEAGTLTKTFTASKALPKSFGLIQPSVDFASYGLRARTKLTYWNGGEYFFPGRYKIINRGGGLRYNSASQYAMQTSTLFPDARKEGYYIVPAGVRMAGLTTTYATLAECETANINHFQEFDHPGGPLGMLLLSKDSSLNSSDKEPIFELQLLSPTSEYVGVETKTQIVTGPTITYFNNGNPIPAGPKKLTYVGGGMRYGQPIGTYGWAVNLSTTDNFKVVYNDGLAMVMCPPALTFGGSGHPQYGSQVALETAAIGQFITFTHTGGTIGIYLSDLSGSPYYADNTQGSPNPQFKLEDV